MKITYLVPGSGGTFFCGNCYRDKLLISSLKSMEGIDVSAIPLYLLPNTGNFGNDFESQVFFGAVSLFLREKVSLFRNMPVFLDKLLDSPPVLKFAARQAGTTSTEGLEEITLGMIKGDSQVSKNEISRLAKHITETGKSDIIHLSNALIIGLASQLKESLNIPVLCSLQNEDDWIDVMAEPYRSQAWQLIGEKAKNITAFITPSNYYKELILNRTEIDNKKIHVIPSGVEINNSPIRDKSTRAPSLGFFSRLSRSNGFDKLIDAFLLIKKNGKIPDLRLHLCGGYTNYDKPFVKEQLKKIKKSRIQEDVIVYSEFTGRQKQEFFNNINVMSVPVNKPDAYGLYLLESIVAGVPVVQPATGAFPEIIGITGGGITYQPDTVEKLAEALEELLLNTGKQKELGEKGREAVFEKLTVTEMTKKVVEVYRNSIS